MTREPLNSRKLAQHARLADGTEARTVVRQLNQLYDRAGRAFRIEEVAGGFRLLTRRQFAPWLRRLEHVPPEVRLSAPAMETLAVVAYRQPVLRAEIEAIRGVNCGEIVRQLMERDLVRIGGRSDELGRPYLYTTTKRFLQLFGLESLDELPRAMALRNADSYSNQTNGLLGAPMSTDEAPQEQEKLEVTVTSPTQLPAEELLQKMSSFSAVVPAHSYDDGDEDDEFDEDDDVADDDDEFDDDDVDDDDVDDDDVDDDDDLDDDDVEDVDDVVENVDEDVDEDDEFDEFEDDDDEDDDDDDDEEDDDEDDFEDEEWEEVDDDDEDLEEGWDDEDDEEWDDDDFDDDDEDDDDDVEESDEEEDWEE